MDDEKPVTPVIPDVPTHDNTMMSAYSYCQRLYALSHVLNRKSRFTKPALSFGGLVHVGLNGVYTQYKEDDLRGIPRSLISAGERAISMMEDADFEDPENDYRTRAKAEALIVQYLSKYRQDAAIEHIVFTETAHDVTFPDGFKWGGINDMWGLYLRADPPL